MTNDGDLTNRLTHPKYGHSKEYEVLLARRPDQDQLDAWRHGVILEDGYKTAPAEVRFESAQGKGAWVRVIMEFCPRHAMPSPDEPVPTALEKAELSLVGEFLWGSNYTFSVQVEHDGLSVQAVYKPTRGERPLWDFPRASLARREAAAYQVSEALGWRLVPPTVYRQLAPIGPGSLQLFVQHNPEYHYFIFQRR